MTGYDIMKKYYFDKFFYVRSLGVVNYITQNKNEDEFNNSCIRFVIKNLKKYICELDNGIYIALTHKTIVNHLRKSKAVKMLAVKIPGQKFNVNILSNLVISACKNCEEKLCCKAFELFDKSASSIQVYIVFFIKT